MVKDSVVFALCEAAAATAAHVGTTTPRGRQLVREHASASAPTPPLPDAQTTDGGAPRSQERERERERG
jgi:hypothetical protein